MEEKKTGSSPDKERGRYHNDYGPRYRPPYDIYEKARDHMRSLKKREEQKDPDSESAPVKTETEKYIEKQRKTE